MKQFINISFDFQVFGNLVAFEDANFQEASKSNDCWNLVDSFEHNVAMGDVFSAGADFSWTARHRNVSLNIWVHPGMLIYHFLQQNSNHFKGAWNNGQTSPTERCTFYSLTFLRVT